MNSEKRQFFLKIAAVGVVGLLVLDHMVITPVIARWKAQTERLDALSEKVNRGEQLLKREDSLRNRWASMEKSNLPPDNAGAESDAFKAVGRWARDSQIVFTSLTPQWRLHDEGYKTLECRIAANGDQASIGRFIYELETDPMPVSLEECEISTRDANGSQLTLTARFSFLRLPDKGGKAR